MRHPVNIKQINATKIHDVRNVSGGNLLVGMRLTVEILRYSFDLDLWMVAVEITVGVASS